VSGLVVLIIGVLGVAFAQVIAEYFFNLKHSELETALLRSPHNENTPLFSGPAAASGLLEENQSLTVDQTPNHAGLDQSVHDGSLRKHSAYTAMSDESDEADISRWLLGLFFALLTGICGGSVGLPSIYAGHNSEKAKFLISFAVGISFIVPVSLFYVLLLQNEPARWHVRATLVPGLFAGVIWNCGNLASYYAISALSYAVA
jgi:hypothetical protein